MRWAMSWRHRGHECSRSQQPWQQQTWPQGRKIIWGCGRDREGTRRVLLSLNTAPSTGGAGEHSGVSAWGAEPRTPISGVRGSVRAGARWDRGKDTEEAELSSPVSASHGWWVEPSEVPPEPARSPVRPHPALPSLHPRCDAQPRLCPGAGGRSTRAVPGPGWAQSPGDGSRPPSAPCSSPGCAGSHLLLHAHNALRLLLIPLQRGGRGGRGARGLLRGSAGL